MQSDRGLTRRQALAASAAAAGAAALGAPRAAQARDHDHDREEGHGPRRDAPPLTLTGARLLDPARGTLTDGATIVFERGVVQRAGRGERPASGGRRIDVGGAYVLPGLIDAHTHAATVAAAKQALAAGATTIRSGSSSFYQDVGLRALGEYGGLGLPRRSPRACSWHPTSATACSPTRGSRPWRRCPTACATPTTWRSSCRSTSPAASTTSRPARRNVRAYRNRTAREVYDERQIRAVVNAARKLRGGVMCHGHGDEEIRDSVRAGVRSVEHGTFASAATLNEMRARGTFLVPTLSAVVDLAQPGGEYTDPRLVERGELMLATLRTTVPAAYARGIPIVAGTDTSYTAASLSSVAGEVRLLGEFGLSNLDALRAATTTAATLVGLERGLGRLRPGYAADALVVGANPLGDLAALSDVRLVVAGGWVAHEAP